MARVKRGGSAPAEDATREVVDHAVLVSLRSVEEPYDSGVDVPILVESVGSQSDLRLRRMNSLARSPPASVPYELVPSGRRGEDACEPLGEDRERSGWDASILWRCNHLTDGIDLPRRELLRCRLGAALLVVELRANVESSQREEASGREPDQSERPSGASVITGAADCAKETASAGYRVASPLRCCRSLEPGLVTDGRSFIVVERRSFNHDPARHPAGRVERDRQGENSSRLRQNVRGDSWAGESRWGSRDVYDESERATWESYFHSWTVSPGILSKRRTFPVEISSPRDKAVQPISRSDVARRVPAARSCASTAPKTRMTGSVIEITGMAERIASTNSSRRARRAGVSARQHP